MIVRKLVEITGADTCKEVNPLGEFPDEDNYERYPLPICFDPHAEQAALYGRKRRIEREWQAAEDARQEYNITYTGNLIGMYVWGLNRYGIRVQKRIVDDHQDYDPDIEIQLEDVDKEDEIFYPIYSIHQADCNDETNEVIIV